MSENDKHMPDTLEATAVSSDAEPQDEERPDGTTAQDGATPPAGGEQTPQNPATSPAAPTAPAPHPAARTVTRATHLFLFLCTLMLASLLAWAWYGELDIVSMADGEVIPASKVKRVEHLEGGIVRELLVGEGQIVEAGQPLVILEETAQGSSMEEIRVRINSLKAQAARLAAQAEGRAPVFPDDLKADRPDLVKQALDLYRAAMTRLNSEIASQREDVLQRQQDIQKITVRLANSREAYKLLQKELSISEGLLEDQLTSELQHIKLKREATALKSKIDEDETALVRARSAVKEGQEKQRTITHAFREDSREELLKVRREIDEFTQRSKKFSDTLRRTVIRSPVAGTIKALNIHSPGEVVKAAETIMLIVPSEDRLVIEAHLPIQDIGYVQVGQPAVINLASQDSRRFGKLDGEVTGISPDTFSTESGRTYYAVRIETEKDYFEGKKSRYQLYPGMLVVAYIHTGKRTVLEYILSPFIDSLSMAFHER